MLEMNPSSLPGRGIFIFVEVYTETWFFYMKQTLFKITGIFFLCLAILFGHLVSGPNYNHIMGISLGASTISLVCFSFLFRLTKESRGAIKIWIALSAFFCIGFFIEQLLA